MRRVRSVPLVVSLMLVGYGLAGAATAPSASAAPCLPVTVTALTDRYEIDWSHSGDVTGDPQSFTLVRKASIGPTATRTLSGTTVHFTDRAVSPDDGYAYSVVEKTTTGQTTGSGCFASPAAPDVEVVISGADSSGVARLVARPGFSTNGSYFPGPAETELMPAFSRSGRLLAYVVDTGSLDIVVRPANGSAPPEPLLDDPDLDELDPAWSPDGRRLAFVVSPTGESVTSRLAVADLTTGEVRVRTDLQAEHPAFSADGRMLVATNLSSATASLLTLDLSTGKTATVPGTAGGYDPSFSRTGLLAYAEDRSTPGTVKLHRTNLAGTGNVVIHSTTAANDLWSPRFTPDSMRIFWLSTVAGRDHLQFASASGGTTTDLETNFPEIDVADSFDLRLPTPPHTSDFDGDGRGDLISRDASGVLWLQPTRFESEPPTMGARMSLGSGWGGYSAITAAGDVSNDGRPDVLARDSSGRLWVWTGTATGLSGRHQVGSGWAGVTPLAPGDFDGDGVADLMGRFPDGGLYLWSGTGLVGGAAPSFVDRRKVGTGFGALTLLAGVGDMSSDGYADLVGRDGTGTLWLFRGNGHGGFFTKLRVGTGWGSVRSLAGLGDAGRGTPVDLAGVLKSGALHLWAGGGYNRVNLSVDVASGWQQYNAVSG